MSAIFITISYESKVKLNGEPIISVSTGRSETRRFQRKDSAISAVTGRWTGESMLVHRLCWHLLLSPRCMRSDEWGVRCLSNRRADGSDLSPRHRRDTRESFRHYIHGWRLITIRANNTLNPFWPQKDTNNKSCGKSRLSNCSLTKPVTQSRGGTPLPPPLRPRQPWLWSCVLACVVASWLGVAPVTIGDHRSRPLSRLSRRSRRSVAEWSPLTPATVEWHLWPSVCSTLTSRRKSHKTPMVRLDCIPATTTTNCQLLSTRPPKALRS